MQVFCRWPGLVKAGEVDLNNDFPRVSAALHQVAFYGTWSSTKFRETCPCFPTTCTRVLERGQSRWIFPWLFWSRGEEFLLQRLQIYVRFVFSFVPLDFCLGFPSLPGMSFPHPLTRYLSFKPQASSALGQLPPFYMVHAKSLQSCQDSLWSYGL